MKLKEMKMCSSTQREASFSKPHSGNLIQQGTYSFIPLSSDSDSSSETRPIDVIASYSDNVLPSDEDIKSESHSLEADLKNWSANCKIPLTHLSQLLKILKRYHPQLPSDARTFFKNKCNSYNNIIAIGSGEFWYKGIEVSVKKLLESKKLSLEEYLIDNKITIDIGIDGLSLFKSKRMSLWPIMGCINGEKKVIFLIAAYCGEDKPSNIDSFLRNFVEEVNHLKMHNVTSDGRSFKIEIRNYICDSPARSYLKCIKPHNGYNACERCCDGGQYFQGRMTFVNATAALRTDRSFAQKRDEEHHAGVSPLESCETKMVTQFPLEYMHLICQGVMRRLLCFWLEGRDWYRLPSRKISAMSDLFSKLNKYCPQEFSRRPCGLQHWKRFKATELRMLLLYSGPVIFKKFLERNVYEHFMLLSAAIRILASPTLSVVLINVAEDLLRKFVLQCVELYGQKMVVYNVHSLIHLTSDVKIHGHLDLFSAFGFENFLKTVKARIRSPFKPLKQLINRDEEEGLVNVSKGTSNTPQFYLKHAEGPTLNISGTEYKKVIAKGMTIQITRPGDKCIMTKKGVFTVENIVKPMLDQSDAHLIVRPFLKMKNFLDTSLLSKELGICKVKRTGNLQTLKLDKVLNKCFLLPDKKNYVVIPLLHLQ